MNRKEKLLKILGYFGYKMQCAKLVEETQEFVDSFGKNNNTLEELADMFNVQCQLELYRFDRTTATFAQFQLMCDVYELNFVEMVKVANEKIERTIERIGEGYYEVA